MKMNMTHVEALNTVCEYEESYRNEYNKNFLQKYKEAKNMLYLIAEQADALEVGRLNDRKSNALEDAIHSDVSCR